MTKDESVRVAASFDPDYNCSCGGHAVERVNRTTRQKFIGCSEFPRCRNSAPEWSAPNDFAGYGDDYRYDYEGLGLP
jgi:ssDNA-binding Zn-finger/Zn-ribbon topoisomerase 1